VVDEVNHQVIGEDRTPGRDVGGSITGFLMGYLQREAPPETLQAILRASGETRTAAQLADAGVWSSYAQMRRLLEATSAILGGEQVLRTVGEYALDSLATPELTEVFHALGSPNAVLENLALGTAAILPIAQMAAEEVSPGEGVIRFGFRDGYEPFPEFCAFLTGLISCVPKLFGYTDAKAVDDACQCRGDSSCELYLRWTEDDIGSQVEHHAFRARLLEARLEALQRTVAELVSGEGLEIVLPRIIAAAARAVHAPSYVLSVDRPFDAGQRLYCEGIEQIEAERLMSALQLDRASLGSNVLVADVSSGRARYGHLAAIREPGSPFEPHEASALDSYASLAAAAMDSAFALDKARWEAATSRALLDLSSSLVELGTSEGLADRIVTAVPSVIDCDQALVVLFDHFGETDRSVATFGYDPEADAMVRSTAQSAPLPAHGSREIIWHDPAHPDADHQYLPLGPNMALGVTTIIRLTDQTIGWISAGVLDRPERLRDQPDLITRLHGLAGHASVAISNARLVEEIRHQSLHDALTGLPNRMLILDRIEQMLARGRRDSNLIIALLFIDLDSFKDVNDTFGHEAGDELLKAVAARFVEALRGTDSVGRLGGDEFVVLSEGAALTVGPELMAQRLIDVLDEPFILGHAGRTPTTVSATIGIAVGVREHAHDLLRDGDVALYAAKAAGKKRYVLFEPQMGAAIRRHHKLDMDLRMAFGAEQFFLVYQPTFDLRRMRVTGVEALLRWRHPIRGVIEAEDFISTLETSGMIVEVGRWILAEACRQTRCWHNRGYPIAVSVNVSSHQLQGDVLVRDVRAALDSSGLDPSSLIVELTETSLMRNTPNAVQQLRSLRALGVRLAIDDFGIGYSSLGYLGQFPADSIKIDRSFIAGAGTSSEGGALLHTLIQLGKALKLETLAEGIEDAAQLSRLQAEDCDSGQGFLFARPLEPARLQRFLETGTTD
jgi:diguanylate cyclase (GGDEF)-like protein